MTFELLVPIIVAAGTVLGSVWVATYNNRKASERVAQEANRAKNAEACRAAGTLPLFLRGEQTQRPDGCPRSPPPPLQLGESDTTRSAGGGLSRRPRSRPSSGFRNRRHRHPAWSGTYNCAGLGGRTVRLPRSRCGALKPFHPDVRQPRSERRRSGMIAPATGRAGTGVRSATNRELVGRLARVAGAVLCHHGRDVHRHGA